MVPAHEILLADADVLIDYAMSYLSMLRLTNRNIGQVHVLAETLATVRQLSVRDCRQYGIQVVQTGTDVLLEARTLSGPLSFEDWLCFITCRNMSWTCLTNDRALIRTCRQHDVLIAFRRAIRNGDTQVPGHIQSSATVDDRYEVAWATNLLHGSKDL